MPALHLKYRPTLLDEVVGNESTVNALESIIGRRIEDRPHSFLFYGNSGCGKTSLARILSKSFETAEIDLSEVDSADFRGIDTIRQIRQNMYLSPMGGKSRTWILDECHQLSKDAQSALLKALEDTPKHVYFILCTTDPQKLLPTIRSRCTSFKVEALKIKEIFDLMDSTLKAEDVKIPLQIRLDIAENCNGSAREALVMLDTIIDLDDDEMEKALKNYISTDEEEQVINLCRLLIKKDKWLSITKILYGLEHVEPEKIRRAVIGYCSTILMNEHKAQVVLVGQAFQQPFYNNGRFDLLLACSEAWYG